MEANDNMQVTAIANFKGGVGKTTTAVNLAAIWADGGYNTLLIDADPQHNASTFYRCEDDRPTLTDVLRGCYARGETGRSVPFEEVFTPAGRERLWVLPADMELLALDLAAMRGEGADMIDRLRALLRRAEGDGLFDRVIIDCPPSFTAGSVAALSVAELVILPTAADAFSAEGAAEMERQIRTLNGAFTKRLRVLITLGQKTRLFAEGEALLRKRFRCLGTVIRACVKVPESTYAREPLVDYAPRCTAAVDYITAAAELETLLGNTAGEAGGRPGRRIAAPVGGLARNDGTEAERHG